MLSRTLNVLGSLRPSMGLGLAIVLAGMCLGWFVGRYRGLLPVRAVGLWVKLVAVPLIRSRSWLGRAAAIFANNILILTGMVALGTWPVPSVAAAAFVGLGLGIALRVLSSIPEVFAPPDGRREAGPGWRMRVGVTLNLLEPPAIVVAVGLSLGRWMVPISSGEVWETHLLWVLPAMLIAAAGESAWLGERGTPALEDQTQPAR